MGSKLKNNTEFIVLSTGYKIRGKRVLVKDNKNYPQLHIQLLEPRIMFDGAAIYAASEALDILGDQQSIQVDEKSLSSDLNPIIENSNSRKEIVFIDSGVDNYQTIVDAIDTSKFIYLIDSNENGFEKMQNVLQGQSDVDAVHIIGHASAGQAVSYTHLTLPTSDLV